SFTTIQKWEDGSSTPPAKTVKLLAEFFGVSLEDLLNESEKIAIPILGTVRGGSLRLAQDEWLGQELVPVEESLGGEYFYLEVIGDSMMNARIFPGDLVYVKRQAVVNSGSIAVVLVGDEATLKRVYYKDNGIVLHPENPKYEDMVFSEEDIEQKNIQIIGEVIHSKIRFK
ncbi:MAG: XRE family transcriptional regulator, partial [Ignavibacteria bacterium]|nr:XRE family transcriptional regulator [Ignavibacteria bacterium]